MLNHYSISYSKNGREMIKLMKMSKSSLSYLPLGEGLEARQPIALQFLSAHVESMHQNENCGFIEEYRVSWLVRFC